MTSNNFLAVKSHLTEFKANSDKDAASEASSQTTNSMTSAEDLQKLAVILGISNVDDVYQERFRVDRRRLEAMLAEGLEECQTAQAFFHRIMNETNTLINWPARLKIGARSKKDPHVRVAGRVDDVRVARENIMQLLDTRNNRVTMKIDVSYTDHSHIIGKGGLTIKRVMEETGCHIHFPDSNRTSSQEKSNQVSIAGDMECVERARARVRALTPLVFCFELPILGPSQQTPDINSQYVKQLQEQYNVQVSLRTRPKLHATLVVVKGVQWEVNATMEVTTLLLKYMCGVFASQTKVQMSLEISPIHHGVVAGRGAQQLKVIMSGTRAQVMMPDAEDPNIPSIKKSCVTITGDIQDVYAARQQLIGSLPLVIIFDIPEELYRAELDVAPLMQQHKVYISVRRKPKQRIFSVVIKGVERYAQNIYEARRALLGGREPAINAEVPESYTIPNNPTPIPDFTPYNPFSPTHLNQSPIAHFNVHSMLADMSYGSPMYNHNSPNPGFPTPLSPVQLNPPIYPGWLMPSPPTRNAQFIFPNVVNTAPVIYNQDQNGTWTAINNEGGACRLQPIISVQPPYATSQDGKQTIMHQMMNGSSQASSGYQSNFTGSSVSLDAHSTSGGESNIVSPSMSPISKSHSPVSAAEVDRSQQELATIISDMPLSDRRAVGCEKKTLEAIQAMSPLSAYNKMKADAHKAMQEDVSSTYRVPTPRWSGYYFSHTSPSAFKVPEPSPSETNFSPEKWGSPNGSSNQEKSGTPAASPHQSPEKVCRYQQLVAVLKYYDLHKYIELFTQHELDLSTFTTLTDTDLLQIGVSAFGARRKMLIIIEDIKKKKLASGYNGAANAGTDLKLQTSPPYNVAKEKW